MRFNEPKSLSTFYSIKIKGVCALFSVGTNVFLDARGGYRRACVTDAHASAHVHVLLDFIKGEYQRYSTGNVCGGNWVLARQNTLKAIV